MGRPEDAHTLRTSPPRLHSRRHPYFIERIGVSKVPSTVDYAFLEHCLREDLNARAARDGRVAAC